MSIRPLASDRQFEAQALAALAENDLRIREVTDHLRDVLWLKDAASGQFVYVNAGYEAVFGRNCSELYATPSTWLQQVHADDCPLVAGLHQDASHLDQWDLEYRILRPSGDVRWISERAFPVRNAAGSTVRIAGLSRDVTERKVAEREISAYARRLREMASELDSACEKERRRIAEGLHDCVGQNLALIRLQLGRIKTHLSDEALAIAESTDELVRQTIGATRSLVFDLTPPALYELGFWPAVEWLGQRAHEQSGLAVRCEDELRVWTLNPTQEALLFRVVRELLHNTLRHAAADSILLRRYPTPDGYAIELRDDGQGFLPPENIITTPSLGLFLSHERISLLGGWIDIDSAPGEGATVTLHLPASPPVLKRS